MFLIVMFNYTALFRATHNTESTTLNTQHDTRAFIFEYTRHATRIHLDIDIS